MLIASEDRQSNAYDNLASLVDSTRSLNFTIHWNALLAIFDPARFTSLEWLTSDYYWVSETTLMNIDANTTTYLPRVSTLTPAQSCSAIAE